MRRILVVGASLAGLRAAETLRREGFDGTLTVLGAEDHMPYDRPPLSKELLAGESDDVALRVDDDLEADWVLGDAATALDLDARTVSTASGRALPFDGLVIATGSRPRRLPGLEPTRPGVLELRTLEDARALRATLKPGARLVLVGAGFIGAEVASTARDLGADVTVLEAASVPLGRVLGERLGAACARLHTAAGVDLRVDADVRSVTQHGDEVTVTTANDTFVSDLVVVGIGMVPNDEIARDSGLETGNGIHVDQFCRTSVENVYAAGDVANHFHPLYGERMRVEHFDNASKQGAAAAQNMLGLERPFEEPHWFWSDQYGANLQHVGHTTPGDDLVLRGDPASESWSAFYLHDGLVRAAFAFNRPEDVMVARELIAFAAEVPPHLLADDDNDLTEILESL
jgi:3-phenylpropionate/trans-cinnamate dioxygenase ferredoxin reductase component